MNHLSISRRRFCQLTSGGLLLAPSLLRAQASTPLTAREVVNRIHKNVGHPWITPTADEFKTGDPDAPITGITTSFMSTLDVLERSVAAGSNFIITHEPTFWSANDIVSRLRNDRLYRYKLDYIEQHKLVVWRFHDNWHAHHPDGIFLGWDKRMGWESYHVGPGLRYVIPETTLDGLAAELQTKQNLHSLRIVGDGKLRVSRIGNAGHYIGGCMGLLPSCDVILVFECREWEAAEYIQDAIASGQKKALIQLPHEGGEEYGMDECARWLGGFVTEVPIKFIPAGDPFWMPA
jgi:putative NIF3 family GTP cyclohydrolase 1 type 2